MPHDKIKWNMQSSFRRSLIYVAQQYGLYSNVKNCIMDRNKCSISMGIFVTRQDTSSVSEIEWKIRFPKFEIFKTQNRLLKNRRYIPRYVHGDENIFKRFWVLKTSYFWKRIFQSVSETQGYRPGFTKIYSKIERIVYEPNKSQNLLSDDANLKI